MYTIVRFLDESDAPGIVCTHWINEDENVCLYPNVKTNEARDKLLRKLADPDQDWSSCRVKILHKYNSFNVATQNLRKAEDTSNLESEDETVYSRPRKRTKRCFIYPGEESDGDCTPPPSQSIWKNSNNDAIPYPVPPGEVPPNNPVANPQIEKPASSYKPPACSSSHTIMNGKLTAWMADISVQVRQLEIKMNLILENQTKLLVQHHQVPEKVECDENFESLGSLPVTDDGSFIKLNKKISEDNHLRHLLIKVLISVGGKDMRCHIHNMLRRVLGDEVAELYTLSGKSTVKNAIKKPFLATEFWMSIFSACQRIFKEMANEAKVKEAVGNWLNQAKVRKIRRMQRHEKNTEKNVELL